MNNQEKKLTLAEMHQQVVDSNSAEENSKADLVQPTYLEVVETQTSDHSLLYESSEVRLANSL